MKKKQSAKKTVLRSRTALSGKLLPARAVSAANTIVKEVREALLAGKFQSGDFLGTETTLADHFRVGRSPIRDALRSLEAMGIVEIRAGINGGVYVAEGNPDLFAEVLAIQLKLVGITLEELLYAIWAVETMAVDLAIENLSQQEVDELFKILDDLSGLIDRLDRFVLRSMDFHAALANYSQSRALIAQAKMLRHILFKHYLKVVTDSAARDVLTSLTKLAEALAARSHSRARRQLEEHYYLARQFLLQQTQPTWPDNRRARKRTV